MTTISVIIPLYNAQEYLRDAVHSVLTQTYQNFEIIIVDDCSTDKSLAIANELKNEDDRITVLNHYVNKGVSAARNTGISHASTKYCAFLDADDLWESSKLETHINYIIQNPAVGFTYDCSSFIDEQGEPIGLYQIPSKFNNLTAEYILLRNPVGNGSSPVVLSEAIKRIKFNEQLHFSEDTECWLRFYLQSNEKVEGINKLLTKYRIRSNSASSKVYVHLAAYKEVLSAIKQYAPDLIKKYGSLAMAYHLRYLARRSIKDGQPGMGLKFITKALFNDYRILIQEPVRTSVTFIVSVGMLPLPKKYYDRFFNFLSKKTTKKTSSGM